MLSNLNDSDPCPSTITKALKKHAVLFQGEQFPGNGFNSGFRLHNSTWTYNEGNGNEEYEKSDGNDDCDESEDDSLTCMEHIDFDTIQEKLKTNTVLNWKKCGIDKNIILLWMLVQLWNKRSRKGVSLWGPWAWYDSHFCLNFI